MPDFRFHPAAVCHHPGVPISNKAFSATYTCTCTHITKYSLFPWWDHEVKKYCLVEEKVTTTLFASTYPTPAECTQQFALPNSTCTHTHTQAHTHATHAHTCTPIAPGLPVAACGRETSWLPTLLPHNNTLSIWLPQHPYAKMFLCEQGASCTLTPPKQHNNNHPTVFI